MLNLTDLKFLNEAEILQQLKRVFLDKMLCCQCGTALLVINPFQTLDDERGEDKLFRYAKKL